MFAILVVGAGFVQSDIGKYTVRENQFTAQRDIILYTLQVVVFFLCGMTRLLFDTRLYYKNEKTWFKALP